MQDTALIKQSGVESLPDEAWKDIVGYEGLYQVSNFGRVKSLKKGLRNGFKERQYIMKPKITKGSYFISLIKNGKYKVFYLAKLISKVFIPNDDNFKNIIFKDGNRLNINVSNLEWSNLKGRLIYLKNTRDLAIKEYLEGKTIIELSKKYKAADTVIRNWIIKSGNKMRTTASYKRYSDEFRENVLKEFNLGVSAKKISKKYNCSKRFVTDFLEENGIDFREFPIEKRILLKKKAIDLYVNKNMNCCEISKIIGISNRSILDWVKQAGVHKSMSEINAIMASNGKKKNRGKQSKLKTRFGVIRCDSSYERERLIQLDSDKDIKSIIRCNFRIPYNDVNGKKHHYNPDFFIEMNNGSIVVEEVKPKDMIHKLSNPIKHSSCERFCNENGFVFRVVTEKEIFKK